MSDPVSFLDLKQGETLRIDLRSVESVYFCWKSNAMTLRIHDLIAVLERLPELLQTVNELQREVKELRSLVTPLDPGSLKNA